MQNKTISNKQRKKRLYTSTHVTISFDEFLITIPKKYLNISGIASDNFLLLTLDLRNGKVLTDIDASDLPEFNHQRLYEFEENDRKRLLEEAIYKAMEKIAIKSKIK